MSTTSVFADDPTEAILQAFRHAPVLELSGNLTDIPKGPGAYLLGLGSVDPIGLYEDAVDGGDPQYGGSTRRLRKRVSAYLGKLERAGLLDARPVVAFVPTYGPLAHGYARLAEEVLLAKLPLAWNHPTGPLWGIAGNPQGCRRHAPPAPWWRVHGSAAPDSQLIANYRRWWDGQSHRATGLLMR